MRCYLSLVVVLAFAASQTAIAIEFVVDDFDGGADARVTVPVGAVGTSAVITPDNSLNLSVGGAPGAFPSSGFDIFGRTNRLASFDFGDDSLIGVGNPGEFAGDSVGIVPFTGAAGRDANDHFFGTNDVQNGDNLDGGGSAVWTIDISGLSNLSLTAVFSAMGDYEAGDNAHMFTASIDGGSAQTLFSIDANEEDFQEGSEFQYTLEDGAVALFEDPLEITDSFGTRVIDNSFTTTGTSVISGTGSVLTITYTAGVNNGSNEPFAFDNLVLSDVALALPDADFNDSDSVDGVDLAIWESNFGTSATSTTGDADGDGDADGADFLQWQREFTGIPQLSAATVPVPEPTSVMLIGLAMALLPLARRQRD